MSEEERLIEVATFDPCDKKAGEAMTRLKKEFDSTYFWCWDCDGLVCKEKDCCLNSKIDD